MYPHPVILLVLLVVYAVLLIAESAGISTIDDVHGFMEDFSDTIAAWKSFRDYRAYLAKSWESNVKSEHILWLGKKVDKCEIGECHDFV